jgi:hypothetical protein
MNQEKLFVHVHNAITGIDSQREMTEEEQAAHLEAPQEELEQIQE